MIMGLTHESASQATMSEWAIMFIRNVSEMSEKLKEEIGKIKMEVKVEWFSRIWLWYFWYKYKYNLSMAQVDEEVLYGIGT